MSPSLRAAFQEFDSLRRNVPTGYGDLPSRRDRRDLHPFEAALCLDRPLRQLARASGAIDRALALRLAKLRQSRGTLRLGYSSFGDYARERLGMSERVAHDLARLGKALHSLPGLDDALQRGVLTWSAALQVARIARASDEQEWIERAREHSVHELKAHVKDALAARSRARTAAAMAGSRRDDPSRAPDPASSISELDRRTIRKRVQATRLQARCWYAATELCEQLVAAPMSPLEPTEYVLAEFLSGTRVPACDPDDRASNYREAVQDKTRAPGSALGGLEAHRALTSPTPCIELDKLDAALSPEVSPPASFVSVSGSIFSGLCTMPYGL